MGFAMLLFLLAAAHAETLEEVPNPREHGAWVSDVAGIIPDEAEARINQRLNSLHAGTDAEVAVVTVSSVPDEARAFATGLFERWGVGDEAADNGLVVLLVVGQRRLSMVTGYGLEPVLPDGWLGELQSRAMVPRFKEGDLAGGLEAGLVEIDARLRERADEVREGARSASPEPRRSAPVVVDRTPHREEESTPLWPFAVGGGAVGFAGLLIALGLRPRRCPDCGKEMRKLDEVSDDAHLSEGQNKEEEIGSVRHDVWVCTGCKRTDITSSRAWLGGYDDCPRCQFRTVQSTRRTLEEATTTSTGVDMKESYCVHCHHRDQERIVTPMIVVAAVADTSSYSSSSSDYSSSSSSSDSGSSFGGGDTGGGGADSSW